MRPGVVLWITGLSGSGKTTLAKEVVRQLRKAKVPVLLVDGDAMRELMDPPPGHTREERLRVARYLGRLCRHLSQQGVTVVCPTISLFHDVQEWNRKNIPGYFEVFIHVPQDVLFARDPHGLYERAKRGDVSNVVGVDIPAEEPRQPDWVWENKGLQASVELEALSLIEATCSRGKLEIIARRPRARG